MQKSQLATKESNNFCSDLFKSLPFGVDFSLDNKGGVAPPLFNVLVVNSEILYNIQFITEQGKGQWWFDGERVQFRSENSSRILELLLDNPNITYAAIKEKIGINMSAIQKQLKSMMDKGYIIRTENGEWRVIITQ